MNNPFLWVFVSKYAKISDVNKMTYRVSTHKTDTSRGFARANVNTFLNVEEEGPY